MEINNNGNRFKNYYKWEDVKNAPYNYERNGLLQHIMSNVIVKSKNEILQTVLKYFESSLIYLMKYIDHLKNFKNYHWYNR
jgi:hypothetical protein